MELSKTELERWNKHFRQYRWLKNHPAYAQEIKEREDKIIELSKHGAGIPQIRKVIDGGQIGQIAEVRMSARRKHLW